MSVIVGTNGNDDLNGTANSDLIISGNGADTIDAGDGNDLIFSGNGADTIDAGGGNDVVFAGNGDDTVDGGDGHDLIFGGRGDDTINGGAGNDLIFGGKGDDIIDGGEGCDIIAAGSGNDLVIFDVDQNSGAQNYFSGGSGNDTLRLRLTQAQVNEMTAAGVFAAFANHVGSHSGFDFSTFGLSFAINLKVWRFEQIEVELTGSPGLFTSVDDTVDFNTVVAGSYTDGTQYDGLDGNDTVTLANDVAAAAAAGYVVGTAFNAGAGDDTVNGGALDDIINGDAGNDVLNGGTGVDVLNGGDDDDRLILEDINVGDSVDGGTGNDTFVFAAANRTNHRIEVRPTEVEYDTTTTISVINVEAYELKMADGNDVVLISTAFTTDDIINGLAGNDILIAGTGLDMVFGGAGNDSITLNDATVGDSVDGGADTDTFVYREFLTNNNTITVSLTDVTVDGTAISYINIETVDINAGAGNDTITGSANNDILRGQADDDTISGGDGNDIIQGGTGVDMLFGDAGNDTLSLNDANVGDSVDGGADTDTFNYIADANANVITINPGDVTVDGVAITVSNIETIDINAGAGNDSVTGSNQNETLRGGADDDTLDGGTGNDILQGGTGNDRLILGDVNLGDNVNGGADNDTFVYAVQPGSDHTITTSATQVIVDGVAISVVDVENYEFTGAEMDDSFTTADGDDVLSGGDGNDSHNAGGGDNDLSGGDGNDQFAVTDGNNMIDGGAGTDSLFFINTDLSTFTGDVTIDLVAETASVAGGGNSTVMGIEGVSTGSGDDNITGDGMDNTIFAGDGDNTIFGGGGNDTITVTDGNNTIDGEGGDNTLGMNTLSADTEVNLAAQTAMVTGGGTSSVMNIANVFTGTGNDILTGDALSNAFFAGAGDDTLEGGIGQDNLMGDAGNDTFVYRAVIDSPLGTGDAILDFDATNDLEDLVFDGLLQGTFNFVGAGPFTITGNTEASFDDVSKLLSVDLDGDGTGDMGIVLNGVSLGDLDADDFSFI